MERFHEIQILFACLILIAGCSADRYELELLDEHRPYLHFSPKEHWMNDPNGMVFYEGEYHLFFQYNPDSTVWGPMHWGHAVSKDLLRWEELPIALYPDTLGTIFSGSAVIDWNNTTGFGEGNKPAMVAIFTHHNQQLADSGSDQFQYQSLAYSLDNGRNWTKYPGNPVLPNPGIRDFRDPKVIWHEASEKWVMVLAAQDHVRFYGSQDLQSWEYLSEFGKEHGAHSGVWECPDLFPRKNPVDGSESWVLLVSVNPGGPNGGSATQYFVGDFNGEEFLVDSAFLPTAANQKAVWLDYGRDNYAGVTWSDIPADDGRRIFMGWMNNWDYANVIPTSTWRGAMTLPRRLDLVNLAPIGKQPLLRLLTQPVEELEMLRDQQYIFPQYRITEELPIIETLPGMPILAEITGVFEMSNAFEFIMTNTSNESLRFGYDVDKNQYYVDRQWAGDHGFSDKFGNTMSTAPRIVGSEYSSVRIFIDASSIEFFADGGLTVLTETFFPSTPFNKVIVSERHNTKHEGIDVYSMKSIWQEGSVSE